MSTVQSRSWRVAGGLVLVGCVALTVSSVASASIKTERVLKVEVVAGHGRVLFDLKGFALYTYAKDTRDHSRCSGSCLAIWPALTVAHGVRPTGLAGLGVFNRGGGVEQVTWKGWPLYTFASDARGKVSGNGVADFRVASLTPAKSASSTSVTTKSSSGW